MKKYVMLAQEKPLEDGRMVCRIKALRDFGHVKKGEVGGFIETTDNLSQKGNCWIEEGAIAAGRSKVSGDALLKDRARLDRHALATDRAVICDDAFLTDFVSAYDDCRIGASSYLADEAIVRDQAVVMCLSRYTCSGKNLKANLRDKAIAEGCVRLEGQIQMADNSRASGNATIQDWASLNDDVRVSSHATVQGKTKMYGKSYVGGHAVVGGKSKLYCNATVGGHAQLFDTILSGDDYRR